MAPERTSPLDLVDLANRVAEVFEGIHRRVFLGDPVSNPRLGVEVVEPALALDTPCLVLVTPWTLNGLAFPPDGRLAETLEVVDRRLPALTNELDGIGPYHAVNLMGDVSAIESPAWARRIALAFAEPFRDAVAGARSATRPPDPGRRRLLRLPESGSS
jgi:hypothetical protein